MRLALLGLCLAFALPAAAQWTRVDGFFGIGDFYATNLVAADESMVYATALAGQPVPNRFLILRSPDDGASWETTFSGYNGAARGTFLGEIDGTMAALVTGNGEAGLLLSSDQGATWAETPARIPSSVVKSVARMSGTTVVVGSNPSYRSTDGGAMWTTFGQDQPMGSVLAFEGAFYGLSGVGQLHRLEGDAWTPVNFGAPLATSIWASGGNLWAKASANAIYGSPDGSTWAQHPTAEPTLWGSVVPASDDGTPWFHYNAVFATDLFLSTDDGETLSSIGAGYPLDANGSLCTSTYAVTPRVVIGNAWACSFTDLSQNGVFRYAFAQPAAQAGLDPGFGLSGKAVFNFGGSGFETPVAVLPLAPEAGFAGGGGGMYIVGNSGSVAKLDAAGALDASFGTGGIAPTPTGPFPSVSAAASGPDGSVVLMGSARDASSARVIAWRLTASGALDASYGTGGFVYAPGSSSISDGEALADGSLLAFGEFDFTPGQPTTKAVVRITASGEIDTAYGTDGYATDPGLLSGVDMAVDVTGRALLASTDQFTSNGQPIRLSRLNASGQTDTSFGTGGEVIISGVRGIFNPELPILAVDAQGRALVTTAERPSNTPVLYRFTASGDLDVSFGTNGRMEVPLAWPSPWVAPDGSVYLSNNALVVGAPPEPRIVHVLPDGTFDADFGTGGTAQILVSGTQAAYPVSLGFDSASRVLAAGTIYRSDRFDAYVLRMMPGTVVEAAPTPLAPAPSGALTLAPNPTRGATSVRLALPAPEGDARIAVYDALGREVAVLHTGPLASGEHVFRSPEALAPGVYLVRALLGEANVTRALTVVR